jgi:hypothetical protein
LPILYESGLPELFIEKAQMNEVFGDVFSDASAEKTALTHNIPPYLSWYQSSLLLSSCKGLALAHSVQKMLFYKRSLAGEYVVDGL